MLNYANLNDMEFEALCRDVMERKLNVPLRCFGAGRDGGVDLTNDANTKNIVVQVKHIQEDDFIVDGSDDLVEEYLSDPPGHYESDDDEDTDVQPYSPIDAIFQR